MGCDYSVDDFIQLKLLENFPLILPQNNDFSSYDGFMEVGERQFRLKIDVPRYPSVDGVKISLDWELEIIVADVMTTVAKLPDECESILEYLQKLRVIIETCVSTRNNDSTAKKIQVKNSSCEFKSLNRDDQILSHLRQVGFNHVASVGADFQTVTFTTTDNLESSHEITLKLSHSYPEICSGEPALTVINTDLPRAICEIIQKECSIPAAYDCFSQQLQNLSSVWNELRLLDAKAWVIDPTHPRNSDLYRRISIDAPKVMAQITWNPLSPHSKPDIKFQGAEAELEVFQNTYESNIEEWSNSCDILTNLCRVLNLAELPVKETGSDNNAVQETGECCICMSAELNGALPSVICGQCVSSFHALCLSQWWDMLGKSRVIHNHITGECPNCEAEMKCPDPSAMEMV